MAVNIFERYGIKEVANVSLFALEKDDKSGIAKGDVVLYLDTLKVSTTETTAENVSAQGGWGNPKLVTWDYGKDINVTLEDAVVSWEELRIIQGGQLRNASEAKPIMVHCVGDYVFKSGETIAFPFGKTYNNDTKTFPAAFEETEVFQYINMTDSVRGQVMNGKEIGKGNYGTAIVPDPSEDNPNPEARVRFFWTEKRDGNKGLEASEIIISPNTFPGTYKVVGDALIRSEATGADEAFQFVINKAKMLSEVTLNMQAEGDPSTFNMTLNVLRDNDGNMMSLIKY